MAGNKLIFKDAEKARDAILVSQKQEIAKLYSDWADDIGNKAFHYSLKTTPSSYVAERQMKQLYKQLQEQSKVISNEIYSKIKNNMHITSEAVVNSNNEWLSSLGFGDTHTIASAFSSIPDMAVRNIITGQIYDSGWSLSKRIWGDNEQTLKDIYQVVAKGLAENMPIYDIAKNLESYVNPNVSKLWNLKMNDGAKIYKKTVDYNAQRLARTLVQHSYQQTFIATTQKNPFIQDYIWRSNGSRVCELCMSRDGKHFKKDELPMDHPNGMCTMEPNVADDLNQQLADWFNSPDGTYPEIDDFAKELGYKPKATGAGWGPFEKQKKDFLGKYGYTPDHLPATFDEWSHKISNSDKTKILDKMSTDWMDPHPYQKMMEYYNDILMDGLKESAKKKTVQVAVSKSENTIEDFIAKFGKSKKKTDASWYKSLSPEAKQMAKELKTKSGKTWPDWYKENIYDGDVSKLTKVAKKTKAKSLITDEMEEAFQTAMSNTNLESIQIKQLIVQCGGDPQTMLYSEKIDLLKKWYMEKNYGIDISKIETEKVVSGFDSKAWIDSVHSNNLKQMDNWMYDWLDKISDKEKEGVRTYTGSAYWDMNQYLRGQSSSTEYKQAIKDCKSALSKASLPEEVIVRRGADYNMLLDLDRDTVIKGVTDENKAKFIGSIIEDKGFMSTSPAPHGGFDRDIEYVIKLPKGSQAVYVDSISKHKGEEEMLLNCGSKFIIEDIEVNKYGEVKKIYMTLINLQ